MVKLYRQQTCVFLIGSIFICCPFVLKAQENSTLAGLKKLSIEELMDIEVTLVSRVPQKLTEVASAIQVITNEDIRRSGATNVPEALRLVSNLQVAQLNSSAWIISARGFNTVFANKLLVMIDGRSVYTPLFGGVLWELQNLLLEDIDRIEVVSGPGGSLWGANAVNGIINIVTKRSDRTQGGFASLGGGSFLKENAAFRYGGKFHPKLFYRAYGQFFSRENTVLENGEDNIDEWKNAQLGFRMDWYPNQNDEVSLQADFSNGIRETDGEEKRDSLRSPFDQQYALVRWAHTFSERSNFTLQFYYDRYWREDALAVSDELQTQDIDFQHSMKIGKYNQVLWGVGYRYVDDKVDNGNSFAGLVPSQRLMPIYSAFIHDDITFDKFKLTVGAKYFHNVFSTSEIQPNVRFSFTNKDYMVWTAVSRAIRAPSRFDVDYRLPLPPAPVIVTGTSDFKSEKLIAYETGVRFQLGSKTSFQLSGFYNEYSEVYSVELIEGQYRISNGSRAETWGAEFSGFWQVQDSWRLRGGFTYFDKYLRARPNRNHDPSYLGNDVKNQAFLQSIFDLGSNFQLDFVARYLDYIPASFATVRVPEYGTFDARFAYTRNSFEAALVGQNLLTKRHSEFQSARIPRSAYLKLSIRF